MRRLALLQRPIINSAPVGTFGHTAATGAWKVLAKNPWYSDKEKYLLCNNLAANLDWLLSEELMHPQAATLKRGKTKLASSGTGVVVPGSEGEEDNSSSNWSVEEIENEL